MWPFPSIALEDLGWFMVHYFWMGSLLGVFALCLRLAFPSASPNVRYAFSLTLLSVLFLLGIGLGAMMFLPTPFLGLSGFFGDWDLSAWVFVVVPVLPAVWGSVSLVLSGFLLLGLIGTTRLRRATTDAPPPVQELAERLARRWTNSRTLRVRICERIGTPILLGIWRPLILLPPSILAHCRPEQLELILLHELAHIRRRDNLVLLAQRVAEVVFWFQPAVWMVSRWVSRDREFCCDQFVLKESQKPHLYAETLITLAEMEQPKPRPFLAAFFGRDHVFARIRYILNSEEAAMSRFHSLMQVAVLGLFAVSGLLALNSHKPQALAEPPTSATAPTSVPSLPLPVKAPVKPPVAVPVPAVVLPQTVPVLPRVYTQKPEVIIEGSGDAQEQTSPQPDLQPEPQSESVPAVQLQELTRVQRTAKRSWGPEQAEGPPDTKGAGDIQTAWASQTQDGQKEWLICEYAEAVLPSAVVVHETYNPGSLEKLSVFDADGKEHEAWKGTDPTPRTANRGTSIIPIKTKFKIKKVKLFFDSPAVPGWNEIDAVGLREKGNEESNIQWATKVTASSTFAQEVQPAPLMVMVPAVEIQRLKKEVKDLKTEMERLKKMEADLKELKDLVKSLKPKP